MQDSKKGDYVRFKSYKRKIKTLFIIYSDFERILVPEDNGKQNSNESYMNKYKKHVACSKPFKCYLGEDAVYDFIISMVEESKYYCDVMKKHFNKKLVTKEMMKIFRTLVNVGSVIMFTLMVML